MFHLKREHQITSVFIQCPWRNAPWKKSSRSRKTLRRANFPCFLSQRARTDHCVIGLGQARHEKIAVRKHRACCAGRTRRGQSPQPSRFSEVSQARPAKVAVRSNLVAHLDNGEDWFGVGCTARLLGGNGAQAGSRTSPRTRSTPLIQDRLSVAIRLLARPLLPAFAGDPPAPVRTSATPPGPVL